MPHDDDSFWIAIFRKSPLIASCMAICGFVALCIGAYYFGDTKRMLPIRLLLCILVSFFCGGAFIGLIIGTILDSIVGAVRDKDRKKKR